MGIEKDFILKAFINTINMYIFTLVTTITFIVLFRNYYLKDEKFEKVSYIVNNNSRDFQNHYQKQKHVNELIS